MAAHSPSVTVGACILIYHILEPPVFEIFKDSYTPDFLNLNQHNSKILFGSNIGIPFKT